MRDLQWVCRECEAANMGKWVSYEHSNHETADDIIKQINEFDRNAVVVCVNSPSGHFFNNDIMRIKKDLMIRFLQDIKNDENHLFKSGKREDGKETERYEIQ